MSQLFEALHRSVLERSGLPVSQSLSTATELVESAERATQSVVEFPSIPSEIAPDRRLVTLTERDGLGAEKFRFLSVRLRHLQQAQSVKRLLLTSTMAEEGKSFAAANLAITLARKQRQKVLLIDGDLRRPALAKLFGLGKLTGLADWFNSRAAANPAIYQLQEAGIWLLPAGAPPDNPLELLQSPTLSELLNSISTGFEWIIIDSPPVLPLADTSVWVRLAEGVLLVAREGKTERRQLKRGLEALGKANLLGVVFNDCTTADYSNYYQRYHLHAVAPR